MTDATNTTPMLSDKTYNTLKWLVQILLPALGALYFSLSQIWGFPGGEEVVGTLAIIAIFLGTLIGISNRSYQASVPGFDGTVVVETTPEGKKSYSLEFESDPYNLDKQDSVKFKVHNI